jgi:chromosome partitioning protein
MYVIAVLNQKGGSGKTTISTNLASAFHRSKKDVLLIDSDPQGSSYDWWSAKEDHPIDVHPVNKPIIEKVIKDIRKRDIVIIDGAPQADSLSISAMKAANLVLIPVTPSAYDIWGTEALVKLVQDRISITNGQLKAAFVISRAIKGTKIGNDVVDVLRGYELPILNGRTHQRVIYPSSAAIGNSVFDENPQGEAAQEINQIMKESIDYLIE